MYYWFSRDDVCVIHKISRGWKHLHLSTFLTQHLLDDHELWNRATLWFADCATAVYTATYTLGKLLMADVSTMRLVSRKHHPLVKMWPRFAMHLLWNSMAKCFEHGHEVTKTPFQFQIMDKWRSGGKSKHNTRGIVKCFGLVSPSVKKNYPNRR